ncbi:unnamed protein product [Anisakis simplex]|uniref:Nucleotid_trans domain-containing protein n=1 Tax=Anisakis simplex TaxID=6269 RepID=A0A0M3K2D9_ANISI|nr:unnamed protein product [Anisakis simplex]
MLTARYADMGFINPNHLIEMCIDDEVNIIHVNSCWQALRMVLFMFTRHCVVAQTMQQLNEQWILFIDADMGVINPNHLIEKWIDDEVDIIFYDRIYNYEIMAGSYLVRNSEYGRMFLNYWADYEKRLPSSFHGTDNGAIQVKFPATEPNFRFLFDHFRLFRQENVFMELMVPEKINERKRCERIWNVSKSYDDLFVYEACARDVLGTVNKWPGKARILKKGTAWARDAWLTNSRWCENDFILHGWKKTNLNEPPPVGWLLPFTSDTLNMSLCGTDEAGSNWKYNDTLMRSENEIKEMIGAVIAETNQSYHVALERTNDYLVS